MSYDFLAVEASDLEVFGLAAPVTASALEAYYENSPAAQGPESNAIARFLADVNARFPEDVPALSILPIEAEGRAAYIPFIYSAVDLAADQLLRFGVEHQVAVIDVQRLIVFDPRETLRARVMTGVYPDLPLVSPTALRQLLALAEEDDSHVVIEHEARPEWYVQTRATAGTFEVEYRAGDAQHHFHTELTDGNVVAEVMWDWLVDGQNWRDSAVWTRLEL